MNLTLKARIVERFGQQWKFAQEIGIHDSLLSKFVTGAREPGEDHREKIAKGLGCKQNEIFPEVNHAT
jgi:DNA-binding transcriptional regulator YdaS (Cro superfamily)